MSDPNLSGPVNKLKSAIFIFQDYALMSFQSLRVAFETTAYRADMVEQMDQIGVGSLPIIMVALICVGGVNL